MSFSFCGWFMPINNPSITEAFKVRYFLTNIYVPWGRAGIKVSVATMTNQSTATIVFALCDGMWQQLEWTQ